MHVSQFVITIDGSGKTSYENCKITQSWLTNRKIKNAIIS